MFLNILNHWGLSGPPDCRQESMKQRYLLSPFLSRDPLTWTVPGRYVLLSHHLLGRVSEQDAASCLPH